MCGQSCEDIKSKKKTTPVKSKSKTKTQKKKTPAAKVKRLVKKKEATPKVKSKNAPEAKSIKMSDIDGSDMFDKSLAAIKALVKKQTLGRDIKYLKNKSTKTSKKNDLPIASIDKRLSSGIVLPTNNELFGHKKTLYDINKKLGKKATVADMFLELGICNSPHVTKSIGNDKMGESLSDFLYNYDLYDSSINRGVIKKMRPIVSGSKFKFMPKRRCCDGMNQEELRDYIELGNSNDRLKTLQSYILGMLSNAADQDAVNPLMFIVKLRNGIKNMDTFSDKHQWVHPKIREFVNLAIGDMTFKKAQGIYKHDSSGLLRFSDMHKHGAIEYLDDDDIKGLYGISKEKALRKYGATSDIDLLIRTCRTEKGKFNEIKDVT